METKQCLPNGKTETDGRGTSGALRVEVLATLNVQDPEPFEFMLRPSITEVGLGCYEIDEIIFCLDVVDINIAAVLLSGAAGPVSLSVQGLRNGVNPFLSPNFVTPTTGDGAKVTLTLAADPRVVANGSYSVTVVGRSGSLTRSASLTLHIGF